MARLSSRAVSPTQEVGYRIRAFIVTMGSSVWFRVHGLFNRVTELPT